MTHMNFRIDDYLKHIIYSVDRIYTYTRNMSREDFLKNTLVQDAVIRNFEIMGEACRNIQRRYPDFKNTYSDFPLSEMYGMRNILAHGYFEVDIELVWDVIEKNLPQVKASIEQILYPDTGLSPY